MQQFNSVQYIHVIEKQQNTGMKNGTSTANSINFQNGFSPEENSIATLAEVSQESLDAFMTVKAKVKKRINFFNIAFYA